MENSEDPKLTKNLPALRISGNDHQKLKELAAASFRDMADQTRYCLHLGILIEQAKGIRPYIKQVVQDAINENLHKGDLVVPIVQHDINMRKQKTFRGGGRKASKLVG